MDLTIKLRGRDRQKTAKSGQSLRFGSTLRNVHGNCHVDALRSYDHFPHTTVFIPFFDALNQKPDFARIAFTAGLLTLA